MVNDYMYYIDYYNTLYHHGILGQKWGVRRFQNSDGSLTSAGRARYGKGESSVSDKPKKLRGWRARSEKVFGSDFKDETPKDILKREKRRNLGYDVRTFVGETIKWNAIYAVVPPPVSMFMPFIDMVYQSAVKPDLEYNKGKKRRKNVTSLDDLPTKDKNSTIVEDAATTNPNYNKIGYASNCAYSSICYDLRRRGYDVTPAKNNAGTTLNTQLEMYKNASKKPSASERQDAIMKYQSGQISQKEFDDLFSSKPNTDVVTFKEFKGGKNFNRGGSRDKMLTEFMDSLNKEPDGSRGVCNVGNTSLGWGHAFAYEKKDGKVYLIDPQVGLTNGDTTRKYLLKHANTALYYRTDNLEIDPEAIGHIIDPKSLKKKE